MVVELNAGFSWKIIILGRLLPWNHWCGFWTDGIIGLVFFEYSNERAVSIIGKSYISIIEEFLCPYLEEISPNEWYFQHNEVSSQITRQNDKLLRCQLFTYKEPYFYENKHPHKSKDLHVLLNKKTYMCDPIYEIRQQSNAKVFLGKMWSICTNILTFYLNLHAIFSLQQCDLSILRSGLIRNVFLSRKWNLELMWNCLRFFVRMRRQFTVKLGRLMEMIIHFVKAELIDEEQKTYEGHFTYRGSRARESVIIPNCHLSLIFFMPKNR